MKNILFFCFAMSVCLCCTTVNGQVVAWENFDYPDGSAINQAPGTKWSVHSPAIPNNDFQVQGGQAFLRNGTAGNDDVNIQFDNLAGDMYFGFDLTVTDQGRPFIGPGFEYFAHFKQAGNTGADFFAKVDIISPTGGGDYTVGLSTTANSADTFWATDLTYETTNRLIVRYDQVDNVAQMWINPASESDTSVTSANLAGTATIVQFALRQDNTDEDEIILIDDLVIGGTFNDVLVAAPEPGTLAFLTTGVVVLCMRRRRSIQ